jgi:hypothetical protein
MMIQLDGTDAVHIRFTIPWINTAMKAHIERRVLDELRSSTVCDHPPTSYNWLIILGNEEDGLQAHIRFFYMIGPTDQHRITSIVLDELSLFKDRHTLYLMAG